MCIGHFGGDVLTGELKWGGPDANMRLGFFSFPCESRSFDLHAENCCIKYTNCAQLNCRITLRIRHRNSFRAIPKLLRP